MPTPTKNQTLFLTTTSEQQILMKQGFIDRMIYKLVFKPVQMNTFHKISEYLIKKILCEPYIRIDVKNVIYMNHQIANDGVKEIMKRMANNVAVKGDENYIENNNLMRTLRVAIRDSRNMDRMSKYQSGNQIGKEKKINLWYMK